MVIILTGVGECQVSFTVPLGPFFACCYSRYSVTAIGARRVVYIPVKHTLTVINPTTLPYSMSTSHISSMFSPVCGHLTPLHGGTRAQFGEASFQPGYPVIRCQHCKQLTPPTTHTELPPPAPHVAVDPQLTSAHSTPPAPHIAVDPRLTSVHSPAYSPISRTARSSTDSSTEANSFGDFKSASFGKGLLTAQKSGRSSDLTVGQRVRPVATNVRSNVQEQRHRKGKH